MKYTEQEVLNLLKNFGEPATDEIHKTVLTCETKRVELLQNTFSKLALIVTKIRKCKDDGVGVRCWGPTNVKCFQRRLKEIESEIGRIKEAVSKERYRLGEERQELEKSLENLESLLKEVSPTPIPVKSKGKPKIALKKKPASVQG